MSRWRAIRTLDRAYVVTVLAAVVVLSTMLWKLMGPVFAHVALYGWHDWDESLGARYVAAVALRRYHELPWYNPWLCGGFPAWAFSEGDENVISPFLPLYLLVPIEWAGRLEVLGSAVLMAVFTYLAASRVTKSVALRIAVVAVAGLNGRWTFQMGAGHFWHLEYAWMPLAYYFFDRAVRERQRWQVVATAATLAMMVYMGALYPLPHTILLLGVYALFCCYELRTARPFVYLAAIGVLSVGLSAPKLLPMLDLMHRFPRLIESHEVADMGQIISGLTARTQNFHARVLYGPHEWGIYIGWAGVAILASAVIFGRLPRESAFRLAGLAFFVLGMGEFFPNAPWPLLHKLPIFESLHVPTRFFFPGVFALTLGAASVAGRVLDPRVEKWRWLDLVLLAPVAWLGTDIAKEGEYSIENVFTLSAPALHEVDHFAHTSDAFNYTPPNYAGATVLLMKQNLGRMQTFCYGLPNFGEGIKRGAIAREAANYHGEAYVVSGSGEANVMEWSPNGATVAYRHASPGALVVYNMNWDPGWRADGVTAVNYHDAVASPVPAGDGLVKFNFYPVGLNRGLLALALTLAVIAAPRVFARWRTRNGSSRGAVSSSESG